MNTGGIATTGGQRFSVATHEDFRPDSRPVVPGDDPFYQPPHGIAVLAISGEIDIATAHAVEHAIAAVLAEDPPSLIIDLLGVQFLGSVGVGVLVNARDKFVDCDRFSVVARGRITRRIIQLLDLDRVPSLQETVEEALNTARARQAPIASPAPIPREPFA